MQHPSPIGRHPVIAACIAAALSAWLTGVVAAQELALPAVDDSPSAQLLIEQATDQAKANPREAVRLLVQVLDAGPDRLVRAGADTDLFTPVARRVHAMLVADASLRSAFRRELSADADAQLERGELLELAARRIDTEAGLEASLRLAETCLTHGRVAAASAYLDRIADHDLLAGRRALYHASMTATVAARLGQPERARLALARIDALAADRSTALDATEIAGARATAAAAPTTPAELNIGPLGPGMFDTSAAQSAWSETWSAPLDVTGTTLAQVGVARLPGAQPERLQPRTAPTCVGERVFVDDNGVVRAFDRLSGRPLWSGADLGADSGGGSMRMLAATNDEVIALAPMQLGANRIGSGTGCIACLDASTGMLRWEARLDRLDTRADLDGMQPQGAPMIVDGRVIIAARRTSVRMETVSWLLAIDPGAPRPAAWVRVIASSGSVRLGATSHAADAPVLAAGVIYVATSTGAIAAIDPWDGLVRWLRRFPVPVRDAAARLDPSDASTPAVVGDRIYAISPDRSRIDAFDTRDGSPRGSIPTGVDGSIGAPSYLVGDDRSGLVLAVGDHVACFAAAAPSITLWSMPTANAPFTERLHGRVQFAQTSDPATPVVLIPDATSVSIRDARTGAERMRLAGAGNSNSILAGNQLLSASPTSLSGWMPTADAERIVRARMSASAAPDAAIALVHFARQIRSGPLAAEGAKESVRRVRALPGNEAVRAELLELLLNIDAMELASGADRDTLDAAVDESASLANGELRGGFARADRALRRGDAVSAATIAAKVGMATKAGDMVVNRSGQACADAEALRIIAIARAKDARVLDAVSSAVSEALAAVRSDDRATALRSAARIGAGTRAGADALAAIISAADSGHARMAAARLVRECAAHSGATERGDAFLRTLDPRWGPALAARVAPTLPRIAGTASRVVEFPGRLPRIVPDAGRFPRGILALQGSDLVLRTAPSYAAAWRAPIGMRDCSVVATVPDILTCDDAPGGTGAICCISSEGVVRWTSRGVIDPADMATEGNGLDASETRRGPSLVPLLTAPVVAVLGRDGSMTALSVAGGAEAWRHPADGSTLLSWAQDPLAVALGTESDDGSGQALRITAFDAADGTPILSWIADAATEIGWMRIVDGGILVVGTDVGIEARRLAGGDDRSPYWLIDSPDARGSKRSWDVGRQVVVLPRSEDVLAIDPWTGRQVAGAFVAPSPTPGAPIREVVDGKTWVAFMADGRTDFFSPDGAWIGRDAPGTERAYSHPVASADSLFLLDTGVAGDPVPLRFGILLRELDARHGGLESAPPLMLRSLGQRLNELTAQTGAIAVSNGSVIQVIEYSDAEPPSGR
ncbi:MAG: PQQ-binding-like beta-propeller repeat protein [Planctomycetota bacterium]|nr:PQQ-binding-like beta-propeller repeat protein [Planctomycetota bacterium]